MMTPTLGFDFWSKMATDDTRRLLIHAGCAFNFFMRKSAQSGLPEVRSSSLSGRLTNPGVKWLKARAQKDIWPIRTVNASREIFARLAAIRDDL